MTSDAKPAAQPKLTPLADEYQKLVDMGVTEKVARLAVDTGRRERLLRTDVLIEGCLMLANAMADVDYVMFPALVQGQLLTLTGRPGHAKSTVGIALAYALALDRELGPLTPRRAGLVYFVSAEDMNGTRKRIFAEAIRHELNTDQREAVNGRLRWVHVNTTLHPGIIAEAIRTNAAGQAVVAIFVDTGAALFAGDDENSNTQLQDFATSCRAFTEVEGAPCVIVFWHPVKNAAMDNLIPRGGSALLGAVDGNLTLWLDDDGTATLSHTPAKWRADPFEPIAFTLESVPLVLPSGVNANVAIARPKIANPERERAAITQRRRGVLAAVGSNPRSVRELAEATTTARTTVHRDLQHLADAKPALVAKDPMSEDCYVLTNAGRDYLKSLRNQQKEAYASAKDPG